MRRRQAALAKARRKLEVDRHAVVRALQAARQALRAAGARTRQAAAVLEQLARHADPGAVDREQPPAAPALDLLVAQAPGDPAAAFGERLRADFHPRRAHRRGRRLRERRGLFPARAPLAAQDRSRIGLQRLQMRVLGRLALAAAGMPRLAAAARQLVGQRPAAFGLRRLQRHPAQFGQAALEPLARLAGRSPVRRPERAAQLPFMPLRRQRRNTLRLERLEQLQARMRAVLAGTGAPVRMLAHRPSQLLAAQHRKQLRRAPAKRARLQLRNALVHLRIPSPASARAARASVRAIYHRICRGNCRPPRRKGPSRPSFPALSKACVR